MENTAVDSTKSATNKAPKALMAGFKPSTDEELKSYAEKGAKSKETKMKTRPATLKEVRKAGQELKKGAKKVTAAKGSKKKVATAPTGARRGRQPSWGVDAKIKILVDKNPKREGSKAHDQFKLYKDGMTIKEFLTKGGTSASLGWDSAHKLIEIK